MNDLAGRVAIVTGAAQGLGRAYALAFAAAGAIAIVADINHEGAERVAGEIASAGGTALALCVDVADPLSVNAMATSTIASFGRIDVLVNNAALYMRNVPPATELIRRPFEEIPLAEWDRLMRVNVTGPFLCVRAVTPAMRRASWGRIINVSSSTVMLGLPNYLHYVTSKSAMFGFTRSLARELGPAGITVNTLIPGLIATEVANPTAATEKVVAAQCIKRVGVPDDMIGAVLFLASDASRFVTGQSINVDGGSAHV